ncbi:MAG TPA: TonB-dependent receptor plug domain-containing protein [Opitutaceae bacterium]|jgi:iron complex outermembrane receptor protein|nr:TonB-dependent receptor plug domain-containing protein [Opitutaceae bacterium]
MKNTTNQLRAILLALPTLLACVLTGHGQASPAVPAVDAETKEEVVKLPEFNVSTDKADAYRPNDTVSVARIRGQLIDTPLSIAVVPKELVQDLGAASMYDVTRLFSGISNGRAAAGGGILDRQDFRGFESNSRTVDNFGNTLSQANFEPAFIDRIEVVKGPDTILSPTGTPGGSMNVITKSPQFKPANEISYQAGNYNANKATFDSTGPIFAGGHWAYRVIADWQNGQTYVPGAIRQQDVSAQLTYKFSDETQFTFKYFGQQWQLTGEIADPNDNGWYVTDPSTVRGATIADRPPTATGFTYNGWNGNATWSTRYDRVNMATAQFTTVIAHQISMRLGAAAIYDNFNQDVGYITASNPGEVFDVNTGQQTAITQSFVPTSAKTLATHVKDTGNRNVQLQNDYAANYHPGAVSIQPVVGWTYQQTRNPPNYNRTAPLPNVNLFANLFDPPRPVASAYTTNTLTSSHNFQYQAFGMTRAGFYDDRLFLIGGASRLWARNLTSNLLKGTPTLLVGHKDTYLGGFLVKPAPNVSLYYAFSTNAAIVSNNNVPIWQVGKQHEFGLKTEFFHQRLSFSAAHFQIAQTNLTSPNPLFNTDPAHQPTNILTDATSHGFEFDMVGGITKNLSVIASFTEMKFRDAFGRRQRNVPDTLANLLLNYHFEGALKGLSVFGSAVHMGNTAGETITNFTATGVPEQPGFYVAAWTAYNAGASYVWNRYRFNLNVDNVLNSKFAWQPAGRNSVSPYPGITVRLTTTVKF